MLRSMTGFGRFSTETKKGTYLVELQSVNRRFLESTIYLPKEYLSLETDIRKIISKKIFRGQIVCRITFYPSEESAQDLLPDIKILKRLKKGWEGIAKELNVSEKSIDLNFLTQQMKGFYKVESTKELTLESKEILRCLEMALNELILMKEKEGEILSKDINKRLKMVEKQLLKIEIESKNAVKDYRVKLEERLAEFLKGNEDERLLKEIAFYAEKIDITEEIVRLKSHIEQFFLLNEKKEVIGRKMDFLLQEMTREINTISSKSSSREISIYVVEIKSELEKIREQVQNIE
jgi:uncharacterized protein (TIGR00255 family)